MDARARQSTLLNDIFEIFDLKPMNVVATAKRIAKEMGFKRSISRQYLGKLRSGEAEGPTQEKILLLVMTIQELSGYAVRATDLFPLEPAIPEGMPLLRPNGRNVNVPISSGERRRIFVAESTDASVEESAAVATLYVEYGILLRSIAMRRYDVPPDDAEGLVHDAFVAYLQRHTTIREVKKWLMGAVSNASRHYWRDRKREAPLPADLAEPEDPASANEAELMPLRFSLGSLVAKLGDKCREAIEQRYWREQSMERIAELLATSPAYVRKLLVICRRRLKGWLFGRGKGQA